MIKKLLFWGLVGIALQARSGPVERIYINRYLEPAMTNHISNTTQTGYYEQWIDHEHPEKGSFLQRYYIDNSYAKHANAPVFFYICGEAACRKGQLDGAIRSYAHRFHARLIALEHRYYGESQPFNDLSNEHLKYLTIQNALADLARFQADMTESHGWTGKWVSFGGSYPGSLSAYYRMKYPSLVVGAVASSAPVRAQASFIEYDQHVTKVAGKQCAQQMRQVVQQIEAAQANRQNFNQIKHLFSAEEIVDDVDFLYLIADIGAVAVQYGMRHEFCQLLNDQPEPIQGYAKFANRLYQRLGESAVDMTVQIAESSQLNDHTKGVGMRQWYYQSCLEYGYWQVAHPDPQKSTRSKQINLAYHRQICQRLFNRTTPASVEKTNLAYFSPLLNQNTSHIIFTNGSQDPWSMLSLTPDSEWATNPNLIYELIEGTAHCADLHSPGNLDSPALKAARLKAKKALSQWLASTSS